MSIRSGTDRKGVRFTQDTVTGIDPALRCLTPNLRHRRLRDKVPMTFVPSDPYIGHAGRAGVDDGKDMLESGLRQRHGLWVTNARVDEAGAETFAAMPREEDGGPPRDRHGLPGQFTTRIPAVQVNMRTGGPCRSTCSERADWIRVMSATGRAGPADTGVLSIALRGASRSRR